MQASCRRPTSPSSAPCSPATQKADEAQVKSRSSTGHAIQDLAIAKVALARASELDLETISL